MRNKKIEKEIKRALQRRANTHKGDYGHVFILAGSVGMTGAAALAAGGALRSGAGLITIGIPQSLNHILEVKVTEAMTLPLPETDTGAVSSEAYTQIVHALKKHTVALIGPGLSVHQETQTLVRRLLQESTVPVVLDADGINALKDNIEVLDKIQSSVIMTPHPREFSRVFGVAGEEVQQDRLRYAQEYSLKYGIVIVLKGHETIVVDREKVYVNTTGNPGLATGGSGDVLTGMIGAFLGQGMEPFCAAQYAVYIHGLCADQIAHDSCSISLIPSDIIETIPQVLRDCGVR